LADKQCKIDKTHIGKDIAHVAMHGAAAPHDMLPGTEGDSDSQKVPPSSSSTFIQQEKDMKSSQIPSISQTKQNWKSQPD
jgi:hypothetical protein